MRKALSETLLRLAKDDERIFLVTADMGYSVFEEMKKAIPDRTLNIGIQEANMMGFCAGLAMAGKIPFTYTIASFATMRCFEQIRDDIAYQNVNVKIIGTGGGIGYGTLGPTHHSIEDIGIMRCIPKMCIVCPADSVETRHAVEAAYKRDGPVYIRIGKNEPPIHSDLKEFEIGKAIMVQDGPDATIISTGSMLRIAIETAGILKKAGINTRVLSMHTVKPIDEKAVLDAAVQTKAIFTLEEHNVIGGLGSAVSEILAEKGANVRFHRFGIPDEFAKNVGSQQFLLKGYGLEPNLLSGCIKNLMQDK